MSLRFGGQLSVTCAADEYGTELKYHSQMPQNYWWISCSYFPVFRECWSKCGSRLRYTLPTLVVSSILFCLKSSLFSKFSEGKCSHLLRIVPIWSFPLHLLVHHGHVINGHYFEFDSWVHRAGYMDEQLYINMRWQRGVLNISSRWTVSVFLHHKRKSHQRVNTYPLRPISNALLL